MAKSVHELKISLIWDTTYGDFKILRDSLRRTNVGVLEFAHRGTGPASDLVNRNRRYDPIMQITGNPAIQSFTMDSTQDDFLRRSNLVAANTNFPNLKRLAIKALKTNKTLSSLDFRDNKIGYEGMLALLLVRKNIDLNLSGNSSTEKGVQALSKALVTISTITTLDLQNSSIGDNEAQALAEALKTNKTLTTLNLRFNVFGDNGAQALAEALKTNSALITLNLRENSIGNNGAHALYEALKTNTISRDVTYWGR
ncbi:hypothetical protein BGZ68_001633 [Mortierella alpina]|nr:hypothetical protein BGZ68_001633 [Mortierella alpina]